MAFANHQEARPIDAQVAWSPWVASEDQPWDRRFAAHLYRRAAFGATDAELEQSVRLGMTGTLDQLFSISAAKEYDKSLESLEQVLTSSQDPGQLASWWLLRMVNTPCQLLEKMTLFWHGHFATSAEKVQDSRSMLAQNRLLRRHALGSLEPLVQGISSDVAMLIYLDSTDNRKTRPNENYARELMELFCLGPGNYSEQDIKEIARCFTGWEVKRGQFRFNEHQHDDGNKSFFGHTGKFDGKKAVEIVLRQPAASQFIAHKLIRFFVADEIPVGDALCQPIADHLSDTGFDIGSTLRRILSSKYFYSQQSIARKIRGPVEMAVGLLRSLQATVNLTQLAGRLRELGQLPMFPPNVKGWDGGRTWINASTYLGRANLVREIVQSNQTNYQDQSLGKAVGARKGEALVDWLVGLMLATDLPAESRQQLVALASGNDDPTRRAAAVISAIGALPEFQLC